MRSIAPAVDRAFALATSSDSTTTQVSQLVEDSGATPWARRDFCVPGQLTAWHGYF